MDVRLTAEQQQLRDAAAKLSDDLGPGSVQDLADDGRISKLDKQIQQTGWRLLRSDGASGVEVAQPLNILLDGADHVPFHDLHVVDVIEQLDAR